MVFDLSLRVFALLSLGPRLSCADSAAAKPRGFRALSMNHRHVQGVVIVL